jgi:dTDP-4-amino-4,6-dideoxygalactose transaminase
MQPIYTLSRKYNFHIIEDATHAIGGHYRNEPIGNCRYSDITVFSFHPVKIITTAEGGAALTNQSHLAEKMELLRSHGITRNPAMMTHKADGSWYYQQIKLGFNYRMTDLQAALGLSQIERLDEYVTQRHILAQYYNRWLSELPVIVPWQHPGSYSAWHLYLIRLQLDNITRSHREVFEQMRALGIGVNVHYIPVHTQPYFRNMGFKEGDFPEAERYYREAVTLPIYPTMTEVQQAEVVSALEKALS